MSKAVEVKARLSDSLFENIHLLLKLVLKYDPSNGDLRQLVNQVNLLQRLDPLCLLEKGGPIVLNFTSRIRAREHEQLLKDIEGLILRQKPNDLLRQYHDLIFRILQITAITISKNPSDLENVFQLLDIILGICAQYNILTGKFKST